MKAFSALALFMIMTLAGSDLLFAQWSSSSVTQSLYLSTTTYPYSVGIGAGPNNTQSILAKLHVANEALFSTTGMTAGPNLGIGSLSIAGNGSNVGLNVWKRTLTSLSDNTTAGNRWMWYNPDGSFRLYTGTTGDVLTALSSGNVGIGTSSPVAKLDIVSSSSNGAIRVLSNSTIASTSMVLGRLSGEGYLGFAGASGFLSTVATQGDLILQNYIEDVIIAARSPNGKIRFTTGWVGDVERMTIDSTGNVGIGTTRPDTFRLKVKGTIKAKEIVVDTTGWADYVFAPEYDLKSLDKIERFIQSEKHLPGIPSAEEIGKSGIHVGEMQSKLLEKIEELTLYVIQLKKDNETLKTKVAEIERK